MNRKTQAVSGGAQITRDGASWTTSNGSWAAEHRPGQRRFAPLAIKSTSVRGRPASIGKLHNYLIDS